MTTVRIRKDLTARAIEEAGIDYFDVSDPRSGASIRLYDFEWLIAERIAEGAKADEVAEWTRGRFGFVPSAADLHAFADRLGELGMVVREEAPPQVAARAPQSTPTPISVEPAIPVAIPVAALDDDEGPEVEITAGAESEGDPEPIETVAPLSVAPVSVAPVEMDTSAPILLRDNAPAESAVAAAGPASTTLPPTPLAPLLAAAADRSTMEMAAPADAANPAPPTTQSAPSSAAAPKSGNGLLVVLALFVLSAGAYLIYTYIVKPGLEPAHVTVFMAPAPKDLLHQYEGGRAVVIRGEPVALSFPEAGKVAEALPAGSDVKEGAQVASLEAAAPLDKELADVKDRETFYATQLKAAQARNSPAEVKKSEEKLAEKHKRVGEIEERLKRLKIFAPAAGSIAKTLVAAGGTVKEGEPVAEMTGKGMVVEFSLMASEASVIKVADSVQVAPQTGSSVAQGRVVNVNGSAVKVELIDDAGGTIKAGDTVGLVRSREPNLIKLPLNSVGKSETGADQVLVLNDCENGVCVIHQKVVKVFEKTASDAYISSGISAGEPVVTGGLDTLKEGQKAVKD